MQSRRRHAPYRGAKSLTASATARPALWVRTKAGPSLGFGHLRRCLTLAALLRRECRILFLLDDSDPWSRERVRRARLPAASFDTLDCWDTLRPAAVLIDTRESDGLPSFVAQCRERSVRVVSIHDLGLNPLAADVVIDGSIAPARRGFGRSGARYYKGCGYLVLGPEYGRLPERRPLPDRIASVFVNLGGGDSSTYFSRVLEGLQQLGRDLRVVAAPGFVPWGQDSIMERSWRPLRFRWVRKGENTARLVFQSDLAITAGGLSAFEALCAGTPLLSLSYDSLQQITVATLAKAKACIDLGLGDLLTPARVRGLVSEADADVCLRRSLSRTGRRIVDGKGAERVAQILHRAMGGGVPAPRSVF